MDLEFIFSLVGTGLGVLITVLTCIIKLSRNTRVRKNAEKMLSLTEQISVFVKEAEEFTHYTGAEKKNYVLTKMNQYSIDHNMDYDGEYVSDKIEELIETTKRVNAVKETETVTAEKDWLM